MAKTIELRKKALTYPVSVFNGWVSGNYCVLSKSNASEYIKAILVHKAKRRPGRRFFGEAFIASKIAMADGWYSSYKWLTSEKWITGKGMEAKFQKPFYEALKKYIGLNVIANIQNQAEALYRKHKKKFMKGGKYRKPVAPDLWLIGKEGKFRFIESKLPGDKISFSQIAGLALIKKYVGGEVSIINLYPKGSKPQNQTDHSALFSEIYNLLPD
jgi:hypothetical protein